jgi:HAD superfamily hydrolase (TIGR01509 family)
MLKAALIDLDGLLVNSEQLYLEANQQYFKQFDFTFTEEHHRQGTGKKFEMWIKTIVSHDKSGEEILKERNVIFFDLVKEKLALLDGAKELLTLLHKHYKTALVTSSKKEYVDLVFEKTGIASYFDAVFTGEMVVHGKPDPECYLMAAKGFGFSPSECVVFEDAPSGVLAGKNAGMKVIAVPSPYVKGDYTFQMADLVFDNLGEITFSKITE